MIRTVFFPSLPTAGSPDWDGSRKTFNEQVVNGTNSWTGTCIVLYGSNVILHEKLVCSSMTKATCVVFDTLDNTRINNNCYIAYRASQNSSWWTLFGNFSLEIWTIFIFYRICPFNYFGHSKPWYLMWFHLVWKAFYCSGLCVPMWGKLPPRDRPCCRPWPRSRTTAFHGHPQILNRKIGFFT